MRSVRNSLVIAAMGALVSTSVSSASAASIRVTSASITPVGQDKMKLVVSAVGDDIAVGSFGLRVDQHPAGMPRPEGFKQGAGFGTDYWYLLRGEPDKLSSTLIDNDPSDENPAVGTYETTFSIAGWQPGHYLFAAYADNRPAAGPYVSGMKMTRVALGDVEELDLPASNINGAVHQVIYEQSGVYACFPEMFLMPDGRMGISFGTKSRRSHIDPTGGSLSMISSDEGRTWSVTKEPLVNKRWQTKDGRLVSAMADAWIYVPDSRRAELQAAHRVVMDAKKDTIAYLGGAHYRVSTDGGKSWQRHAIEVPEYVSGLMNHHATATELVSKDGLRMTAVYGPRIDPSRPDGKTKTEVFFLRSTDDGKTWETRPMFPEGLPDPNLGFNETALEEASNGDLVVMMRSDPESYLYQSISKDRGLTWSQPVKTNLWGTPADLLRLSDGRLLCVRGYRRAPMGVRAAFSSDNGATWTGDSEYIIRQDGLASHGDLGYPLAAELKDGSLFTVYYMTTDGENTHIAATHWKP